MNRKWEKIDLTCRENHEQLDRNLIEMNKKHRKLLVNHEKMLKNG